MKVTLWLVTDDDNRVVAIFFDEQKAKDFIASRKRPIEYMIEEHETDDTPPGCIW